MFVGKKSAFKFCKKNTRKIFKKNSPLSHSLQNNYYSNLNYRLSLFELRLSVSLWDCFSSRSSCLWIQLHLISCFLSLFPFCFSNSSLSSEEESCGGVVLCWMQLVFSCHPSPESVFVGRTFLSLCNAGIYPSIASLLFEQDKLPCHMQKWESKGCTSSI